MLRTAPEIPNLRAATRWAIDAGEGDLALRLVAHTWRLWHGHGLLSEGATLTRAALSMPGAPTAGAVRAWAVAAAGNIAYWQADAATAGRYYEEQIALARVADDERCLVDGLFNMGHVAFMEGGDESVQRAHVEDVIARYRDLGDERAVARAAWALGVMAVGNGRPQEALAELERGLADFERFDDPQYHAMSLGSMGWASFMLGEFPKAIRYSVDALVESHGMGDIGTSTISLHIGVLIAVMVERFEDAAVLVGAFDALCERYAVRPPAALRRFITNLDPFGMTQAALDPEIYEANVARGRRLTLDEAVAMVVALGAQAEAARIDAA